MLPRQRSMERKQVVARPKRGQVYLVSFDPTVGAETKKTRPALVIQTSARSTSKWLVKRLGLLKPATMERVNRALRISVGLVKL